jgi:hypothetical protein
MSTSINFQRLWDRLDHETVLYGVVLSRSFFYIESPEEESEPAIVKLFLTAEQAETHRDSLINIYDERPSELSLTQISLQDLFLVLEELKVIAYEFYDSDFRSNCFRND